MTIEVVTPFCGRGGLDAEAEKAESRQGEDCFRAVEREDKRQGAGGIA